MRKTPGSRRIISAYDASGGATTKGSPGSPPARTSSAAAVSRTLREITPSLDAPNQTSPAAGPSDARPREGFSPNRPQQAAGIRIDPPPSLPAAIGTIPAATAAAAPPLEPPGVRLKSQGLLVRPKRAESVTGLQCEFRQVGLPEDDEPRLEVPPHHMSVLARDDRQHRPAAAAGWQAGVVLSDVLDQERHAGERARKRSGELRPRLLVHKAADRVDLRMGTLVLLERDVEQLLRARLAARDETGEANPVVFQVVAKPHNGVLPSDGAALRDLASRRGKALPRAARPGKRGIGATRASTPLVGGNMRRRKMSDLDENVSTRKRVGLVIE